jgi:hypothetical protein
MYLGRDDHATGLIRLLLVGLRLLTPLDLLILVLLDLPMEIYAWLCPVSHKPL